MGGAGRERGLQCLPGPQVGQGGRSKASWGRGCRVSAQARFSLRRGQQNAHGPGRKRPGPAHLEQAPGALGGPLFQAIHPQRPKTASRGCLPPAKKVSGSFLGPHASLHLWLIPGSLGKRDRDRETQGNRGKGQRHRGRGQGVCVLLCRDSPPRATSSHQREAAEHGIGDTHAGGCTPCGDPTCVPTTAARQRVCRKTGRPGRREPLGCNVRPR